MLSKKIAIAAIAGTALLAASGAYARDDHYRGHGPYAGYGHRHHGHHLYRHVPQRVFVRPAPVYYYAPEPVYYLPQPVYYAPPRPVIFGQIPISHDARLRIGVQF